ncbi:MAG: extracellular solute-binding protein [Lachnospiraceae bacterium]|nr:extracellular solute-binding protein [Lachnospiraceae bacterium]
MERRWKPETTTWYRKIRRAVSILLLLGVWLLSGCGNHSAENTEMDSTAALQYTEQIKKEWEEAESTPFGKYPELVTYTLGKVAPDDNSNMPAGDTYEDNNYTRYLKELLNVQNKDVLEGIDHAQYTRLLQMSISEEELPDIMLVTNQQILDELVEQDLIADLTEVFDNCTSDRVKEMYESYGEGKMQSVTYEGRIMAFPETEVYTGPSLLWLRKDWIDSLGLQEPKTMEEAMEVVRKFVEENPGANENGNVGLVFDPSLVGQSDQCFSLDPIFDSFHAYPGKWIQGENGKMICGSVTEETKMALKKLSEYYRNGILDRAFMVSNAKNLPELLKDGRSGAFFGWWWAPNNPLAEIYDEEAEWKPYLFTTDSNRVMTSLSYGRDYCVVARKGFEHPEIIPKIMSALFDYARYDGKEEAKGVGEYLRMNVDPTATPFVINLDYSDAIFRTTSNIQKVMDGEKNVGELTVLEQGYYKSCREYLDTKEPEAWQWAAYESRIAAVSRLAEADISYVNEGYSQEFDTLKSSVLSELSEKAFILIITGEKPVEYFDTYVTEWYETGGEELTRQANEIAENRQHGE